MLYHPYSIPYVFLPITSHDYINMMCIFKYISCNYTFYKWLPVLTIEGVLAHFYPRRRKKMTLINYLGEILSSFNNHSCFCLLFMKLMFELHFQLLTFSSFSRTLAWTYLNCFSCILLYGTEQILLVP